MWCLANPKLDEREVMTALLEVDHHLVAEGQVILADKGFAGVDFDILDGLAYPGRPARKGVARDHRTTPVERRRCGNASGSKRSSTPSKDDCSWNVTRPAARTASSPGSVNASWPWPPRSGTTQHRGVEQTITHRLRPLTSTIFGINHLDPEWANPRRLLTGRSTPAPSRAGADVERTVLPPRPDRSDLAVGIAKEELRTLLASARASTRPRTSSGPAWAPSTPGAPPPTSRRSTDSPPPSRPGGQQRCGSSKTGLTNARTEGTNRVIKEVGRRRACGFRNPTNHRRRVRSGPTWCPRRAPAKTSLKPC